MNQTALFLLMEYETPEIPLEKVAEKYLKTTPRAALNKAARHQLPFPAHRLGSQKAGWFVNVVDLANHIDNQRAKAERDWQKFNSMEQHA